MHYNVFPRQIEGERSSNWKVGFFEGRFQESVVTNQEYLLAKGECKNDQMILVSLCQAKTKAKNQ